MVLEKIKNKLINLECFYEKKFISDYEEYFSFKELEKLLNLRPFVNNDRFHIANDKSYTWNVGKWFSDPNTFPISLIAEEINDNLCHLSDCSRVSKKVNDLAKELEIIFGGETDAHIFFAMEKNNKNGFGIHCDASHNLILQISGETKFEIYDIFGIPGEKKDFSNEKPIVDVLLTPGDIVFVPKHQFHRAISQSKRLSISFPVSNSNICFEDRNWLFL